MSFCSKRKKRGNVKIKGTDIKPSERSSKGLPLLLKESAKTRLNAARAVAMHEVESGKISFRNETESFFPNAVDSLFEEGHATSFCGISAVGKLLGKGHGSISPGSWAKQHPETEGAATGWELARYVQRANVGVQLKNLGEDATKEFTLESMWKHFGMSTDQGCGSSLSSFVVNMERSSKSKITMPPNFFKYCGDRWKLSLGSGRALLACMG